MRKTLLSLIAILAFVAQPSVSSVFFENSMLSGRKGKIYSIKVKNAEGKDVKMKQYKGKVLLIVNTATRCASLHNTRNWSRCMRSITLKDLRFLTSRATSLANRHLALLRRYASSAPPTITLSLSSSLRLMSTATMRHLSSPI